MPDTNGWQLIGALVMLSLLLGGGWLLIYARHRRAAYLPEGRIVSADVESLGMPGKPLFSKKFQLVGQPDYLIATRAGLIPVEVKSSKTPPHPYPSHVLQLAAYCLLVEETEGHSPPYGFIKYPDRMFQVPYTLDLRHTLLETLDAMRADLIDLAEVHRNHNETRRCLVCGYRGSCGEALV
ncbi:MAG: CRISPR-associated protein Cas4 [Ardenticatenia bacterium]|jgi:CRISPR-associated exonuclease Cas4|nr:MAG: CRISPR-associated protein Cas4 [Ardenticatenia bacterium]